MSEPALRHLVATLVLAAGCLPAQEKEPPPSIDVHIDPRVELMCVIFRLAGNQEYNRARVPSYADAVDAHFADHRNHPAIVRARRLRAAFGVSYDACMSMAVHLPGTERVADAVSFSPRPENLDSRWQPADTGAFLREVQDFVEESRFHEFLAEHGQLHELTEKRLREVLDTHIELGWFEKFFGARPAASFTVIPGLLNGGGSYGPRVLRADGSEELFSVLGVWMTDDEGKPWFDESIVDTVVHEFCHSYCNPIVDESLEVLSASAQKIWPWVADTMRSQAYGNWETMMKESLVRASTVRYVLATRGTAEGKRAIAYEHGRGFEWTGELAALLDRYESDREKYATVNAFFPEIAEFFEGYADRFVELQEKTPRVVSLEPAIGARDVDPDLAAIVVTFDRPMRDQSWSFVGGGPKFPETRGNPSYDDERKVLTLPVKLKPDQDYEFWLNRGRYSSFRSDDGVALRPVHVTFRTRGR